ncbi:hypothetical protein [Plebeiibacterium marinum]|uniref:Uracil DNA glycosylase superfamily protein n=1 Tax=Plebeiibacterium marinum TaxID=2992111 RepID=A0AAE3MDX2_9BACT|nr:hypothetical protein [Plebeiobacterium marinum]MCW3805739.1 hypothetical protein [Plebeiobacterium marinum]
MNMEDIKTQQEELYQQWEEHAKYEYFVRDGILNYEVWNTTKPKIMFLLKETADDFVNIADNDIDIRNGNGSHFWWNICYWKYVVSNKYINKDIVFIPTRELPEAQKDYVLNDIAYVNVKKQCDNKTKTSDSEILEYANRDKQLLVSQIELINPDIVFCNSVTLKVYLIMYGDQLTKLNDICYKHNNRLILNFRHPSYFQIAGGRQTHFSDLYNAIDDSVIKQFSW